MAKEIRFSIVASSLFAVVTTGPCGAVNAMHDSFTAPRHDPLINSREIVGGVGAGSPVLLFVGFRFSPAGDGRRTPDIRRKIEARGSQDGDARDHGAADVPG
jgi:K+-transporting ATPase ATPase A chain